MSPPTAILFINDGAVVVVYDDDGDGVSAPQERQTFATAPGLNHGLAFSRDGKFLYASSDTTVYRWAYTSGLRKASGAAEVVVKNMPGGGNHNTRTLQFDSQGRMVVNIGSADNVDTDQTLRDTRAQVRRFTLTDPLPAGGIDYTQGEVIGTGLRNEVGLFVDAQDRLWGVENGRDNLTDADFGGDIHDDNPGEEINLFGAPGGFYGYPLCWSEGKVTGGKGPGTQWADQTIPQNVQQTDGWCQDTANVQPPQFVMQGHWAPLGIIQYTGNALPYAGDFLITSHGSWNRQPAVGRVLARATVKNGKITAVDPILGKMGQGGQLEEGTWDARPVDVRQAPSGAVYFSDDTGGRVFRVGYKPQ